MTFYWISGTLNLFVCCFFFGFFCLQITWRTLWMSINQLKSKVTYKRKCLWLHFANCVTEWIARKELCAWEGHRILANTWYLLLLNQIFIYCGMEHFIFEIPYKWPVTFKIRNIRRRLSICSKNMVLWQPWIKPQTVILCYLFTSLMSGRSHQTLVGILNYIWEIQLFDYWIVHTMFRDNPNKKEL